MLDHAKAFGLPDDDDDDAAGLFVHDPLQALWDDPRTCHPSDDPVDGAIWDPPGPPASEKILEAARASLVIPPQPVAYPVGALHQVVGSLLHGQVAHAYHTDREYPAPDLAVLLSLAHPLVLLRFVWFMPCLQEIRSIYFLFGRVTCSRTLASHYSTRICNRILMTNKCQVFVISYVLVRIL